MFVASKMNVENNWVQSIGIERESALVKYVNAFYFACTTMLTIGYGDISPKSLEEKMMTIIIEIVGIFYVIQESLPLGTYLMKWGTLCLKWDKKAKSWKEIYKLSARYQNTIILIENCRIKLVISF